jgi:hypothetical protein
MNSQSLSLPVGFSLETRNRAAVGVWWPVMIAVAAGIAWSLVMMLSAREPDAPPVLLKADREVPLARNGDDLIPSMGLPNEGLPLIDGPSPPPNATSSPASEPLRAEATLHHHARVRHARERCAAHGMRRKYFHRNNHWLSWRCVG